MSLDALTIATQGLLSSAGQIAAQGFLDTEPERGATGGGPLVRDDHRKRRQKRRTEAAIFLLLMY